MDEIKVLPITPVESAEIDRDREIISSLIHQAGMIVACEDAAKDIRPDVYEAANGFLLAWFARKLPGLEMPKL